MNSPEMRDELQQIELRLRAEIAELRNQIHERDHEETKAIGILEGWRTGVDQRLSRLEKLTDNLLFRLMNEWPSNAPHASPPAAPAKPAPPPAQP